MANDYDLTARNVMLDALGAVAAKAALHSADPGGANQAGNELSGGSYARQAITWNAAASGSMDNNANPAFTVTAGVVVGWASFWNTAGTVRYLKKQLTQTTVDGTSYTLTDVDFDLNQP